MTSPISLQLPSRSRTYVRAFDTACNWLDWIKENVGLSGGVLERFLGRSRFLDAFEHRNAGPTGRQMLSRAWIAGPVVQQKFSRLDRGRDVPEQATPRVPDNANGLIEPSLIHVLIPQDRAKLQIGGGCTGSQAGEFVLVDVVVFAADEHPSRILITKRLSTDEDPLPIAPIGHRFALRRMPRLVDRNLIRPVGTHHTHHSNQNATQCRTRQEVACPHFHEGERA